MIAARAKLQCVAGIACALLAGSATAAEPTLTVMLGARSETYTPASLLAHPAATTITIPHDVSYKRSMTYRAVPVAVLLSGVAPDATLRFLAEDGFAANQLAAPLLADSGGARAYLAVEPADASWPPLKPGDPTSAGPFYLVWLRPELGRIQPEQWPYQVKRIDEMRPLAQRFPAIVPAAGLAIDGKVNRGFATFTRNCMVCHTMNLGGDATIGPDLNVPYNPTEYLRADALRRLIRDPQSLRHWTAAKMPAFNVATLSDRDYNDVLAYLQHMTNRKSGVPVTK